MGVCGVGEAGTMRRMCGAHSSPYVSEAAASNGCSPVDDGVIASVAVPLPWSASEFGASVSLGAVAKFMTRRLSRRYIEI